MMHSGTARARGRRSVLAVAILVAALAPTAGSAAADDCPDPAGDKQPFATVVDEDGGAPEAGEVDPDRLDPGAEDPYALVLNGGGWGHGIGMSQYGARGAALLGCGHRDILGTYFPGTAVGTTDTTAPIRVGLWPATPSGGPVQVINVENVGDKPLPWSLSPAGEDEAPPEQPPGVQWTVRAEPGGGFTLREGPGADAPVVWPADGVAGAKNARLQARLAPTRVHLTSKGRDYARGTLEFISADDPQGRMIVVNELPSIEKYLYGLGEVPSSWPAAALQAQAVAGRSYAATTFPRPNCLCDLYDSVYDQAYVGASKEDGAYGAQWVAAVDATRGEVLTYDFDGKTGAALADDGAEIVRAYYSSSNGGTSSAAWDIWGSDPDTFPYLAPVDTSAWEEVDVDGDGAVDNGRHRWSFGFTAAELAQRFAMDEVTGVEVVEREPGGRPCLGTAPAGAHPCDPRDVDGDGQSERIDGFVVTGRVDGETVHRWYASEELRWTLGVWSGLVDPDVRAPLGSSGDDASVVAVERHAGAGRVDTAVALSEAGWPQGADAVVLARADHPADALAGSGLAGRLDAPMLLTATDALPEQVGAEIERLGATRAWLLGGTGAIAEDVADALRGRGLDVERVAGAGRFATAGAVADQLSLAEDHTAYLVRMSDEEHPDREWADALSVSAVAARRAGGGAAWPVLGVADVVPTATWDAIERLGIQRVVPVGGAAVVSDAVLADLEEAGIDVAERLAGVDRWATSRAIVAADTPAARHLVVATGMNFPDGLAAGAYAARVGGTLLLTPTEYTAGSVPWRSGEHPALLGSFGWETADLTVVGGPAAVTDAVVRAVRSALDAGAADASG